MSALSIFNNGWLSLFLLLTGPFVGSFISASALTWPDRSNLRTSRSQCAQCGAALTLVDLVPLFSFFLLRGRCRHCKTPIRRQHIIAELASTTIALSSVLVFDGWLMLASAGLGMVLLFIALVDYRTRLIPDGASFSLIGSGPLVLYFMQGVDGLKTGLGAQSLKKICEPAADAPACPQCFFGGEVSLLYSLLEHTGVVMQIGGDPGIGGSRFFCVAAGGCR